MRKHLLAAAATIAVAAAVAFTGNPAATASASTAVIDATSPIKHVVIIYQENHSFDDVLGQLCQSRVARCDGYTGPVTFADGKTAKNIVEPDISPVVQHSRQSQLYALANQYDKIVGCAASPYRCVTHYGPTAIPNLAALANKYVVADRTFASNPSQSFGAHMSLGIGTMDGFTGDNPQPSVEGVNPANNGWGCSSKKDALWSPTFDFAAPVWMPSCIPNPNGSGAYEATRVPYRQTIMEQMESASLSWHIYQGNLAKQPTMLQSSICTYYAWCAANRFTTNYNSSYATFTSAAAAGTMPNLSLLLPIASNSQHNGDSMATGDNYIGSMVNAVMNGPEWNSTAIFITYDDCGCFYDHVSPPAGLGMRNPMVIVSPWAKSAYTDSGVASNPYSMLSFVDHTFGLPALSPEVGGAYDFSNSFDFTTPTAGVTPQMVHTPISRATKQKVAQYNRTHAEDPT
jgi:phospholipase C